jgi:phytoene synthase
LVAGTVGLMLTPIIASEQYPEHKELIDTVAISLGKAMQITNILRDVGQDYLRSRVYLPKQLLEEYGVNLKYVVENGVDEAYKKLIDHLIGIAEDHYNFFYKHIKLFNKDARKAVYFSAVFYQNILIEIIHDNYNNLNKRQFVSSRKKKWLVIWHSIKLKIQGVI